MSESIMDADKAVELVEQRLALLRNHLREWRDHVAEENRSIQVIQAKFVEDKSELRHDDYMGLAAIKAKQSNDLFQLNDVSKSKLKLIKERQQQEFLSLKQQIETDGNQLS